LAENDLILLEKIRLLALMEMTFRRDANDRQLTFADIAKETGLPVEQVELLVKLNVCSVV
jgi:26S proteasome regulatory subunit N9